MEYNPQGALSLETSATVDLVYTKFAQQLRLLSIATIEPLPSWKKSGHAKISVGLWHWQRTCMYSSVGRCPFYSEARQKWLWLCSIRHNYIHRLSRSNLVLSQWWYQFANRSFFLSQMLPMLGEQYFIQIYISHQHYTYARCVVLLNSTPMDILDALELRIRIMPCAKEWAR